MVRVPLGWSGIGGMAKDANPREKGTFNLPKKSQTVEFRAPDGSANIHHLLAGLAVAAGHGLGMKNALELADKLYVDVNIFAAGNEKLHRSLHPMPTSCRESADCLRKDRRIYEKDGVFSPKAIDGLVAVLEGYNDRDLARNDAP